MPNTLESHHTKGCRLERGSRKHVLDWTGRPQFTSELQALLRPASVRISDDALFMPRGAGEPEEARLERFGPAWQPDSAVWRQIEDWWLCHKRGANTPNWDIAAGCEIDGSPGLVLVEAKANWPELGVGGKPQAAGASANSHANHQRIGEAIAQANAGWRAFDPRVSISRDSHYQLANRLAFTWKLASLGVPVVLLYLGFTGDVGLGPSLPPFVDDADWHTAFDAYSADAIPSELFERRLEVGSTPLWLLSRSRSIIELSPPRAF